MSDKNFFSFDGSPEDENINNLEDLNTSEIDNQDEKNSLNFNIDGFTSEKRNINGRSIKKNINMDHSFGKTPEINDEEFNIKRSYQFRESTIRKLNEIKAVHPDINIYLNQIIDAAVSFYYDYFIKNLKK